LPSQLRFASLFEEEFCEVSKERVAHPWAWDIRYGNVFAFAVEGVKEVCDRDRGSDVRERELEKTFD